MSFHQTFINVSKLGFPQLQTNLKNNLVLHLSAQLKSNGVFVYKVRLVLKPFRGFLLYRSTVMFVLIFKLNAVKINLLFALKLYFRQCPKQKLDTVLSPLSTE